MVNENRTGDSSNLDTEDAPAQNGPSRPTQPPKAVNRAAKPSAAKAPAATAAQATSPIQAKRRERREEMIKARKEDRLNRYEKQRQQWLYTRIGIAILVVVVVLGLGYGGYTVYSDYQDRQDREQDLESVVAYDLPTGHVAQGQPVTYEQSPPVGGQHDPYWQTCQYYSQPIRNENAVHSMEHGAVWITYRPDLPQDQIDELREIADGDGFILVSPYPDLQAPVVVQSWNHQLVLDGAFDSRLETYIREYKTNPDETPEYGASCSGGVTSTVS